MNFHHVCQQSIAYDLVRGTPKGSADLSQRPVEEQRGACIAVSAVSAASAVSAVLQAVHLRTSSMLDAAAAVPRSDNVYQDVPGTKTKSAWKILGGNKMPVTTTGLT